MKFFLSLFFLSFTFIALSQRNCGFQHTDNHSFEEELHQYILRKKNNRINTDTEKIYSIPVVVHIIHNNLSGAIGGTNNNNISNEQIFSQFTVLNKDFRRQNSDSSETLSDFKPFATDTKIEFCLATRTPDGKPTNGITRTYYGNLPFDSDKDNSTLKSLIYWPSSEYLNIWVTELSGDVLGYAQFPNNSNLLGLAANEGSELTDGIVINHKNFGARTGTASFGAYSYGRTATHEIGHWLGLLHIWGNTKSCGSSDFCNDTPKQENPTTGCPNTTPFTCDNYNMIQNYMDYTNDNCMNLFTKDQKERMRAVLETAPRRKSLLLSLGCCGVKNSFELPFLETFDTDILERGWSDLNSWKQRNNTLETTALSNEIISPHLNGKNTKNPILQFDIKGNTINTPIYILYEITCSGKWDTLLVIDNQDFTKTSTQLFSVPKLARQEAIRLFFTTSSQNVSIDNLQLYEKSDDIDFIIYPNPVYEDNLTIKTRLTGIHYVQVEIFDNLGKIHYSSDNQEVIGSSFSLNNLTLTNGLYIIRIKYNDSVITKHFIVHRE